MNTRKFFSFIVITAFILFGAVKIAPMVALADDSNPITVQNVVPIADLSTVNCGDPLVNCLPTYFIVYLSNGAYENWNVGSWISSPTYNGSINGTYTFTTTLTEPAGSAVTSPPSPSLTGSINFNVTGAVDGASPTPVGSNAPGPSSILPNTQGSTIPDSGTILPGSQGTNSSDSGSILPNTQGSDGDESTYSVTTSVTPSTDSGAIACGDDACPSSVYAGTSVTFTEIPTSPSTFTSWGGACSGTATTCTLTINADTSVSADFTVTTTPVTPATNYVGGGSSSSGGRSTLLALKANSTTTPIITCPLITTYMNFGGNNNPTDVAKLQAFLKDSQGLDVTVNGIFDQQMENAVRAFQSKYMSQIMGPWGATQSSGYVYITTLKKVNEIACNTPLTLSPAELAIINAYKNSQTAGANVGPTAPGTIVVPGTLNIPGTTNTGTTPPAPIIGQNGTSSNANVAAVGSFAGAWNNFWGSVWKGIVKIF